MRDDVAFQSQQFGEQVAQRRDRYAAQNIQTWGQLPDLVGRFQQAQGNAQQMVAQRQAMQQAMESHQVEMARSAEQLSLDQLRTEQAKSELMWARELHTTDILQAQKDEARARADLVIAQAKKSRDELTQPSMDRWTGLSEEQMDSLMAQGMKGIVSGGRIVMGEPTPEERAAASKRVSERQATEDDLRRSQAEYYRGRAQAPVYGGLEDQRMNTIETSFGATIEKSIKALENEYDDLNNIILPDLDKKVRKGVGDPVAARKQFDAALERKAQVEAALAQRRQEFQSFTDKRVNKAGMAPSAPEETAEDVFMKAMSSFNGLWGGKQ